ncbi:hypothetical protein [Kitasatospora sp. NPDC087315]|uniref:hypothetical protein n=1 Tax=Kitasatospora sp. NPDC087315 TaxID=3364069 RepID=UPI003813ADEC
MTEEERGLEVTQQQGAWAVRMWWPEGPITGGPQRITIEKAEGASPRDVARGISTTVLRRLDLSAAVDSVKDLAPLAQQTFEELAQSFTASGEAAGLLLANEGVSERYLVMLAATYKAMSDTGFPAPIPRLAQLIDRRPETVKDHLKKARRDGYLSTLAGKAGGELTDKAMAVMEAMAEAPPQQ